jgi:hypothetical protein
METKERTTPITGKEGCEIDLNVAADWTKNYRHRYPKGTISQFFGAEILQRILQQPDCMGIRIYYANSKQLTGFQRFMVSIANFLKDISGAHGEVHLVLTGATKEGFDQIPKSGEMEVSSNVAAPQLFRANVAAPAPAPNGSAKPLVAEQSMPCPGAAGCPKNVLTGAE